ncbi:MAG: Multidrug transporter ATP-binding protein [Myxococcaceae bacterium]|nr:Multidrug transporter ATP-binding protein [Myxococcaceae bacterium]
MSERAAVRCDGLFKRFGELVAVHGVSLTIERGECLGLLGPNGAGKTTTVEMLNGLTEPNDGRIFVLGEQIGRGREAARRRVQTRIGVQLQESELPERLTVRECVRLFRSFYPKGRSVDELLDLLTLHEKQHARVASLSGGQRQRLALACALAGAPEVLFLDEPTTGLDPQARLNVWEVIERFRREGGTVLVTTHYMEEAARLCDRVAIMDGGRIIAIDTPAHLISSLGAEQVLQVELTRSEEDERFLADLPHVVSVRRRGRAFALATGSLSELLPLVLRACEERGNPIATLTTHAATLEDVFVALTGKALRDA